MAVQGTGRETDVELTPGEFGLRGDAVARDSEGHVFSVPGAIPGERVRVRTMARRRGIVHARVVEVLDPSPSRVAPPCPEVEHGCGARQWQHIDLEAQRSFKRELVAEALGRSDGGEASVLRPTVTLAPAAFRTTVHAAVTKGRAGFRRYRSHRVVPVDECLVAHPLLVDLIVHGTYGDADEVLFRCGARTGERLVMPTPARAKIDVPADVRFDHVHELAAGREWQISARSFFQSRPDGVDALAAAVQEAAGEIDPRGRAIDLFSGVGVFAGVLAERGWSVTAVESAPSAVKDARTNLRKLDVSAVRADVTHWKPRPSDLVVADPSRAGLDRLGVNVVAASRARRVILISCDTTSLGRDAALLHRAGYRLSYATPVDLFPHTFHVEVVSVYDR
ncbi:MAG: class I SAM-dependent RNA methyltransferase [Acidimicrobiia bacterium]